jgi:predicted transcriptional regulator
MAPSNGQVSDTELGILKVLWELGEGTVRDVLDARADSASGSGAGTGNGSAKPWAYTTAQTLLNRLVEKGFVETRKQGRAFLFRPTVNRDELLGQSLQQLAERVCDGASLPLLLNLVNASQFTPQEIRRFRSLLDELEGPGGPGGSDVPGGSDGGAV